MIRSLSLGLILLVGMAGSAFAQAESPYAGMTRQQMLDDGAAKVEEMTEAVATVNGLRRDAENAGDVSAYQRLNNLYTQMNGRLLIGEEALAALRNGRPEVSSLKASRKDGEDRAFDDHNYGLIIAAHNSVMSGLREALSIMNDGASSGDGTSVLPGRNNLPGYDTTDRGRTTDTEAPEDVVDNSEFQGATPAE